MIELEQREQNRLNQNQQLVSELKASTSNFKNYLDKTETKVIKISNQMLSKIDTKHMTEDIAKAFRQEKDGMYEDLKGIRMANREQHEALNNSLKENQKLNSTFKSSIKYDAWYRCPILRYFINGLSFHCDRSDWTRFRY